MRHPNYPFHDQLPLTSQTFPIIPPHQASLGDGPGESLESYKEINTMMLLTMCSMIGKVSAATGKMGRKGKYKLSHHQARNFLSFVLNIHTPDCLLQIH